MPWTSKDHYTFMTWLSTACLLLPELDFPGSSPALLIVLSAQAVRRNREVDSVRALTHLTLEQISWRLVAMAFAGVSHRNTWHFRILVSLSLAT